MPWPESHSEKALDSLAVLSRRHRTKCFRPQERLFSLKNRWSAELFLRVRWLTFRLHAPQGQRYEPHNIDVICELPSVPACLYPDFTKWNQSRGSHPQYTINSCLPQRGRRKLKHSFCTLLFVRVRSLAFRLPCKSRAAVLAKSNPRGILFCLLLGPESHS